MNISKWISFNLPRFKIVYSDLARLQVTTILDDYLSSQDLILFQYFL